MCFGEPAERGTRENKANWSRKCHSLTLGQGDFNQEHSRCTDTKCIYLARNWLNGFLLHLQLNKKYSTVFYTLFRNVGEQKHIIHVHSAWRRTSYVIFLPHQRCIVKSATNDPWIMHLHIDFCICSLIMGKERKRQWCQHMSGSLCKETSSSDMKNLFSSSGSDLQHLQCEIK